MDGHGLSPVLERTAGLRIERMQKIAGATHIDDTAAVDLGIRDTLAVVVAHAALPARRVRLAIRPDRLAGRRIDRGHRASVPGDRIEQPVDVERCRAEDVVDARTEVVAAPEPCELEILEVLCVDLIQGRVARVGSVAADVAPLTCGTAVLSDGLHLPQAGERQQRRRNPRPLLIVLDHRPILLDVLPVQTVRLISTA